MARSQETSGSPDAHSARQTAGAGQLQRFTVELETRGNNEVCDLTGAVQRELSKLPAAASGGVVHLFVVGSTAGLTTIEFEPGLVNHDFKAAFDKIAPAEGHYEHEATWNDDNGHSHVRASLLKPDLTIPFSPGGEMMLGNWQQVVVVDFDTRPRRRTIVGTIL